MKRSVLLALAIVGVGGVFAAKSFVYAADKAEPVQPPATQAELDDEAAWEAWRDDFDVLLDEDEEYAAAVAAVGAYGGDDEVEYGKLEAVRDNRYGEIARVLYEEYFGEWDGTDSGFDDLVASKARPDVNPNIKVCTDNAIRACGEGKVRSVTVDGDKCSYECMK